MRIGAYECVTPFATAGSGSARWCVARSEGQTVFLKQFLTPVQPRAAGAATALTRAQRARCDTFERRKKALYAALGCVLGDCVVPVLDFFAFEGRYYAVMEYVQTPYDTFETLGVPSQRIRRQLLFELARCLGRVHAQGIVHADLKPEHVLLQRDGDRLRVRLIDFDSGFLEEDPPPTTRDIEGDPVYLAPETYLRLSGRPVSLTRKLDTFAFGAIAHRVWTGALPAPQTPGVVYLYEAALAGETIPLSDTLPIAYRWLIQKALSQQPEDRPDDGLLERLLAPPPAEPQRNTVVENGLHRFYRPREPQP